MSTSISDSPPPVAASNSAPGRGGSIFRGLRFWVIAVSLLGVSFILYLVIRFQGHVSGTEFAPSHFQQRTFSFYELPWVHLQITPIDRSSSTPAAAQYIRQNNLISVPAGQPSEWHLVSISRGVNVATPADGELLMRQLRIDTGKNLWQTWSEDHPQAAALFWPLVQRTAARELYVLLPRMFEIAHEHTDVAALDPKINEYLRHEYAALIRESVAANRRELANELLAESLLDYADDPTLLEIQAGRQGQ